MVVVVVGGCAGLLADVVERKRRRSAQDRLFSMTRLPGPPHANSGACACARQVVTAAAPVDLPVPLVQPCT